MLTRPMWCYALLGLVLFALCQIAIACDMVFAATGQETISRWHLLMGWAHPRWFPTLVVSLVLFPIGMFISHYWNPQNLPFWCAAEMWGPPVLLAPVILFAGVVVGRLLVAQTL